MKPAKKSLYELLEVSHHASVDDIRAAHGRQVDALITHRAQLSQADFELRMQVLKVALSTLTSDSSRYAYDTQLAHDRAAQQTAVSGTPAARTQRNAVPSWDMPLPHDAQALLDKARRAAGGEAVSERTSPLVWLLDNLKSSITKSLVFIGLLAVMGMVLQMVFFRAGVSRSNDAFLQAAEDRAVIQEYYQTHGVRPASRAEAELLMQENRRKEAQEREEQQQQRLAERQRLDFERETRRRAEEVSAALRRAEEEALRRALQKP